MVKSESANVQMWQQCATWLGLGLGILLGISSV